jgi:hypothetical protein
MGFLDDLGKALKDFDNWITDIQMSGEEVREREVEEVEEERIVELPKFAPVADFFNMVEEAIENPPESWKQIIDIPVYKPSPEVMAGYVPKYAEEVEEEVAEEDELWYKYFTTLDSGYWGTDFYEEVEQVYYSEESGREWQAEDRIVEDYGERYFGKDNEVLGSSDRGEAVPYSEVNLDRIL